MEFLGTCLFNAERRKKDTKQNSTFCLFKNSLPNGIWCLDSGASSHICNDKSSFISLIEIKNFVKLPNEERAKVEGIGTVNIKVKINTVLHNITLEDILFVPEIRGNLLSISKISERNHTVNFDGCHTYVKSKDGQVKIIAKKRDGLYTFKILDESVNIVTQEGDMMK